MSKIKRCLFVSFLICIIGAWPAVLAAKRENPTEQVKLKNYEKKCVLYTIYRGDYKQMGRTVRNLYFGAASKDIKILSTPTYIYLNNPKDFSSEHWLTEIRLDVKPEALEHAGKLGPMTDVKEVPSFKAAAAIKPQGVADPNSIFEKLHQWIADNGYAAAGGPMETILIGATNADYENVKSEIAIPVMKLKSEDKTTTNP